MKKIIFIIGLLIALTGQTFGQLNGDWYSIRTVGFSKISITDNYLISVGKIDSISSVIPDYKLDTLELVRKHGNGDTLYILGQNFLNKYMFDKFVFDPQCNCLLTTFIDYDIDSVPTPSNFDSVVTKDKSKENLTIYYRLTEIESFYQLEKLKNVTADELVAILQTMLEHYKRLADLVERQDLVISPFGPLALVRGNIESEAFIQNGFSPFYNKEDYRKIMEKYKDNKDVQKVMDELQKK